MTGAGEILALLPSRNEAATIASVVRVVDQAILGHAGRIFNIDCSGDQRTIEAFRSVPTQADPAVMTVDQPGKGRQLLLGLEQLAPRTAACLIVDTDNREPTTAVFGALLNAILDGADLAIADYKRFWHEGNLTNQVARPMLYAACGIDLPQPISGDLAISPRLARSVVADVATLDSDAIVPCVEGYGIDAFIVLTAARHGCRIIQLPFDQPKQHAPSFPHLPQIFREAVPVLLAPSLRSIAVAPAQWRGRYRLSVHPPGVNVETMIERLRVLWPDDAEPLPDRMARLWLDIASDSDARAYSSKLWPSYVVSVRNYLQEGLAGGLRAAVRVLTESMRDFILSCSTT